MNPEEENDSEILRKLSPTLFEEKRTIDDAPPDGYFDSFPDKMMAGIEAEKSPEFKNSGYRFINIRNIAIAATIALILAFIPYFKSILNTGSQNIARTGSEPVANDNTPNEDSDEVLASYISEADLYAAVSAENEVVEIPLPDTDSEMIIDYLLDEDVSNQIIIETLNTEGS